MTFNPIKVVDIAYKKLTTMSSDMYLQCKNIPQKTFPNKPFFSLRLQHRFSEIRSQLLKRRIKNNLGSLYTLPSRQTTSVYKKLIDLNPSALGTWADNPTDLSLDHLCEYEVIHELIDLYGGKQNSFSGYVTSGGTEGNLFSLWLGRTFLQEGCKLSEICLLKTDLTHYSVAKSAEICNVEQYFVPMDKKNWAFSVAGLRIKIEKLYLAGKRGFLLPLTIGYTSTGTSDPIKQIIALTKEFEKKHKIKFYVWIDAAFNGLVDPFNGRGFTPLTSMHINTLVVDFHKFGLVPYPAGCVLYRKNIAKLVEKDIDYLSEKDRTLLGSRSAIPAVSIWASIHSLGKKGYEKMYADSYHNKAYFIHKIKETFPDTEIITEEKSISLGLIFHNFVEGKLTKDIEEKYALYGGIQKLSFYPNHKRRARIYKVFFLQHVTKKVIDDFINDIKTLKYVT